jgi:hypothetical protein
MTPRTALVRSRSASIPPLGLTCGWSQGHVYGPAERLRKERFLLESIVQAKHGLRASMAALVARDVPNGGGFPRESLEVSR